MSALPLVSAEVERIARTIYESTQAILAPNFWPGWTLQDFAQTDTPTRHVHHVMARAVLALSPPPVEITPVRIDLAAAAIANARGMRRGVPTISNIMAILPDNLAAEVREDAEEALKAALAGVVRT